MPCLWPRCRKALCERAAAGKSSIGAEVPVMKVLLPCVTVLILVGASSSASGDDATTGGAKPPAKVSFFKEIRPIFQERCQGCHQPAKKLGGLAMTSFAEMQKGGESETPIIMPGKPDESLLIQQIV